MTEAVWQELLKLPIEERIELIDRLWDSIGESDEFALSDAQKAELDRRLADLDAHPNDGRPWETLRDELRKKL